MGDRYIGRGSLRRTPPIRERLPPRDRDDHPNVEYFGQGESYRPGGATGDGPYRPNRDRAGDSWAAERRDDRRKDDIDSYIPPTSSRAARPRSRSPGGFRRRSRSPPDRPRPELFPERTRSPPRRYSPRRDDRPRSPTRRRSRSPYAPRARSPDVKRPRDFSPDGRRSPKRERLASPPRGRYDRARSPPRRSFSPAVGGNYRPRSRTPPKRDERKPAYMDNNWRRRSPSPKASGPASNNTSRRSSPPVHPDRAGVTNPAPRSPAYIPRSSYDSRRDDNYNNRPRSPMRRNYAEKSREPTPLKDEYQKPDSSQPPSGPAGYRNGGYERPPPSGPSRSSIPPSNQISPPTGPGSMPVSAHNRTPGPSVLSAPTGPRGATQGRFDGPVRDFTSPPSRGRSSLTYRAPGYRAPTYSDGPPSGPRGGGFSRGGSDFSTSRGDFGAARGDFGGNRGDFASGRGDFSRGDFGGSGRGGGYGGYSRGGSNSSIGAGPSHDQNFAFRQSNTSTSTTYPRTQRFNTTQQQLSTLEKIIPGGKKLPSGLPPEQEKRIKALEAEAEKIRIEMAEKQRLKREVLNDWEVRQRETDLGALKSELAEEHLRKLTEGEDGMVGAAF